MKSLAEHLGVEDPKPDPAFAEEPTDEELLSMSVRDFARGILRSRDYRRSILYRVRMGELPPAVETLLYHYAEGKPVDRLEVEDKTPVRDLPIADLEQRALTIAALVREARMARQDPPPQGA